MTTNEQRGRGRLTGRFTYANVVATLALVVAMSGGTAYAASKLITGSQIASGTITAKNIKQNSLVANDFAKHQLPAGAKGSTGATGAAGPQGPAGTNGANGANGTNGTNGANGAAGSAHAYATVVITAAGTGEAAGTAALSGSTLGFTSMTHPVPGIFCLSPLVQGADGGLIHPLLSDFGTYVGKADPLTSFAAVLCPSTSYQVDTFDGTGKSSGPVDPPVDSGFVIAIP